MKSQFNIIGIMGRVKNPGVLETLQALIQYLHSLDKTVLVDTEMAEPNAQQVPCRVTRKELCQKAELVIVVGGDGSLLHAAHVVANQEIPVLGINRGRLGFLTDILPTELKKIKPILEGEYSLEERFLLQAKVTHQGETFECSALNEVAIIPNSVPHMNEFEIYIEDKFVCSQDSDGLIVATPTGSTAYALSGGGPILHPELDAVVIVPMFPHTLSLRPIVIKANQRITIIISPRNTTTPRLTCDSQAFIDLPPGSQINIQKKKQKLLLIHPLTYDYYESLRSKLHWGRKLQYSE